MVALLQLAQTQKPWFGMLDKFSLQIRQHVLFYNCKIAKNGKPLTPMYNLQHRHAPDADLEMVKLPHYYIMVSFVNNTCISGSSLKKKSLHSKWVFLSLKPGYKGHSLSPNQSGSTRQRRLCWQPEFTHGKSAQCEFCSPTDFGNKSAENKAVSVQLPSVGFWSVLRFYKVAPQRDTSGPSLT